MSKLGIELADGWAIDKLSNLVEILVSNVDKKTVENEPSVRLCNYMDVYSNEYITSKIDFMKATASKSQLSKYIIREGDVMITKDSETPDDIGIASVSLEDFNDVICGYHLALLKPKKDKIFGRFLAKQLGQYQVNRQFANRANGSTRYGLTLNVIETALIPYPASIDMQRKISGILSTCDTVIERTEAAIAKYKAIKQGLLYDLFTRGLDTNGHLRSSYQEAPALYKESELGMIPKEWEVKIFRDWCVVNPKTTELPESFVYIDLESVEDGKLVQENFISKKGAPSRAQRILANHDVLYQMVRPYQKNNLYFDRNKSQTKYVASTGYAQLRINEYSSSFLFYLLHTDWFVNEVLIRCTGSNYPAINSTELQSIFVAVPTNTEQKEIGKRLHSIDNNIKSEEILLQKYQSIKKGLMGDLLGCRDAMHGVSTVHDIPNMHDVPIIHDVPHTNNIADIDQRTKKNDGTNE
jgi:type I restriction enzyme, S subunit